VHLLRRTRPSWPECGRRAWSRPGRRRAGRDSPPRVEPPAPAAPEPPKALRRVRSPIAMGRACPSARERADRDADRAGLVCDRALYGVADPPGGISGELVPAPPVELSTARIRPITPSWIRSSSGSPCPRWRFAIETTRARFELINRSRARSSPRPMRRASSLSCLVGPHPGRNGPTCGLPAGDVLGRRGACFPPMAAAREADRREGCGYGGACSGRSVVLRRKLREATDAELAGGARCSMSRPKALLGLQAKGGRR
jgi:hypothetical protein